MTCLDSYAAAYAAGQVAMREAAAAIIDQCNRDGPYQAIAAANRIRAIPIAPPPQDNERIDAFREAIDRIKDMLAGDDGQAWFEARKFLKKIDALPDGEVG